MKTYRNLYPQVWDFENLYLAYRKARKGKRGRPGAAAFERVQDDELLALQDQPSQTSKPSNSEIARRITSGTGRVWCVW